MPSFSVIISKGNSIYGFLFASLDKEFLSEWFLGLVETLFYLYKPTYIHTHSRARLFKALLA